MLPSLEKRVAELERHAEARGHGERRWIKTEHNVEVSFFWSEERKDAEIAKSLAAEGLTEDDVGIVRLIVHHLPEHPLTYAP